MTHDLAVTPHDADLTSAPAPKKFFVVSTRKLTVLFLATLGVYSIYWFYKQWEAYKDGSDFDSDAGKMWPVMRALFPMFFVFSLLRRLREEGLHHEEMVRWNTVPMASALTALLLISKALDRAASKSLGSPITDMLALVMLLPLLAYFLSVQDKVNLVCDDPEGAGNARFSKANYAWIALGAVLWLLVILGMLMPN